MEGVILMSVIKTVKAFAALLCGVAGFLWGDIDGLFLALIAFMAFDFTTGLIVGVADHNLNSEICFRGLCKKMLILTIVALGHLLDTQILGGEKFICRSAIIGFYIANEGLSILENGGKLGLPYPKKLKDILAQLRSDGDDKKEENQ